MNGIMKLSEWTPNKQELLRAAFTKRINFPLGKAEVLALGDASTTLMDDRMSKLWRCSGCCNFRY